MSEGTLGTGRSHAATNLEQRYKKARKIARLLDLDQSSTASLRILEVGTGSGVIAHWFGTRGHEVDAVDVVDERVVLDGYRFKRIDGTSLPFADGSFEIVISNHVIEHVGDAEAQGKHLRELARMLSDDGRGYLAVPNRWMLVEPHYGLPFLSWLPRPLADRYLQLSGRGQAYDCRPLTRGQLEAEMRQSGLKLQQHHLDALLAMIEIEAPTMDLYRILLKLVPQRLQSPLGAIFPTLIYTFARYPDSGC